MYSACRELYSTLRAWCPLLSSIGVVFIEGAARLEAAGFIQHNDLGRSNASGQDIDAGKFCENAFGSFAFGIPRPMRVDEAVWRPTQWLIIL
jgi:hypothetical protein